MQGTVDRIVADEGYGFLIGPNGEEYFFHRSALLDAQWDEITAGVPVWFQAKDDPSDQPDEHFRAVNVRLTDDAIPGVDNEPLTPEKVAG